MEEVYVKAKDIGDVADYMQDKDIYSLDEIIGAFEELIYEHHKLEEELERFKEEVETDYRRIPDSTLYGLQSSCWDK